MSTFWQEVLDRPREIYARLSRGQRMGVLALASVGLVVAVLASLLAGRESFAMAYGGLEPAAANEVVSKLTELGIPYRLSSDGTMVQVPERRIAEVKMQLAASGLPKLGSRGFELFDDSQIGITDALFNVNLQRAIQGELEKAIQSLGPVKQARVLVNLPPSSPFQREQARPSAGVTLWLRPGMPLPDSQVAAIAHIVAAGVGRGMRLQDVKIVDGEVRLLHPRGDDGDPMLSAAYLQKLQGIERYLEEKAESQLRAAFGANRASVRVAVELDLIHKETSKEQVDAENKVPVRETISTDTEGAGAAGSDPSVTAKGRSGAETGSTVVRRDEEKQYREGVTHELTIAGAGSIRRMSVSLLLDESDESLKSRRAEIEKAVKSAVGFTDKRASGLKDDFNVVLAPFAKPPPPEAMPGPFTVESVLPLLGHVAEGVTVLFVLVLLARALRGGAATKRRGKAAAGAAGADAAAAEQEEDVLADLQVSQGKGADLRAKLGRFVSRHPDHAREVLVAWLKEEVAS